MVLDQPLTWYIRLQLLIHLLLGLQEMWNYLLLLVEVAVVEVLSQIILAVVEAPVVLGIADHFL
jgi:hypothetical protein